MGNLRRIAFGLCAVFYAAAEISHHLTPLSWCCRAKVALLTCCDVFNYEQNK
jgi:hypothetical protein